MTVPPVGLAGDPGAQAFDADAQALFDELVENEQRIEPRDWMPEA